MAARIGNAERAGVFRTAANDKVEIGILLIAAVTTAMLLQATRVFLSYMVFIIDQSERVQLGVTAGAVYLAIGLGAIVPRLGPAQRMIAVLVAVMVATRLILQFWMVPEARMWLAAATIVVAGWLCPLLLEVARPAAAYGAGVGLALDVVFRVGRASLDLAFIPSAGAHLVTIILAIVAVMGAVMVAGAPVKARSGGTAVSALAFGPALALHHLTVGNLGTAQLRLDMGMDAAAWSLVLGLVLGLALAAGGLVIHWRWTGLFLVVAGAIGLFVFWNDTGGLGAIGLVAGAASTLALTVLALRGGAGVGRVWATSLWLTLGLLIHAILLFAYFTATGWPLLIGILYAVLALVALVASWRPAEAVTSPAGLLGGLTTAGVSLVVTAIFLTASTSTPVVGEPLEGELTVMTFNIQCGFSVDNYWDLERTARVIEDAQPEVVLLQEVGRGWPILSGVDEAAWLAQRLEMQLVWGPASQDDLWGNAILTNAPIRSTDWIKYSTTENLRRGAVLAELETGAGPVTVISTHLDNPGEATSARQAQITQLLQFAESEGPVLLGGDLNTDPDSDAMAMLAGGGFVDTGATLGADATTSDDARRIDYILVTPGVEVVSAEIPDTWASDHRPYVVTVRILD